MGSLEKGATISDDTIGQSAHQAPVEEGFTSEFKEGVQRLDHDDAANLFAGSEDTFQYDDSEARRVRWKLDLILLPMVGWTSILSPKDTTD